MRSFADSGVVVTGATSGIGQAVARGLQERGARVALVARSSERLAEVAQELGGTAFVADVSREADVDELAAKLAAHFGDVPDILVNAAGAFDLASMAETTVETFDTLLAINLRAPFLLMRTFLPGMLARGSGHIVSIGSVAGRQAFRGNGAYSASKFGLRGLHEVLGVELRGSGVRATLIEPAATDTALWHTIDRTRHADVPAPHEMLSAEAVADCVLFALSASEESSIKYMGIERA